MENNNSKPKYDTCFFERYAKVTLATILGERYANLVNRDRPDLQDNDRSIGIEVTRAMRESKAEAIGLLNEMAADIVVEQADMTNKELMRIGYTYGLSSPNIVGPSEYRYWCEASPLNHVLENKVRKVLNGFYGHFEHRGLYVFSKDDTTHDELLMAMMRVFELQNGVKSGFDTLYISEIQTLYVCDIESLTYTRHPISTEMCRTFFRKASERA